MHGLEDISHATREDSHWRRESVCVGGWVKRKYESEIGGEQNMQEPASVENSVTCKPVFPVDKLFD